MPSLSKVRSETRFILKWGSILAILFLVVYLGTVIKEKISPSPNPPPTVSFGKLNQIEFPPSREKEGFKYTIDTLTGKLPEFPDRTKIYKFSPGRVDFLSLEKAKEKVSVLGFKNKESFIAENTYEWIEREPLLRKISYNILSSDFVFSTSFLTDPIVESGTNLPTDDEAIGIAKRFFESQSSFPKDIDETKTKIALFSIKNYTLIPADEIQKAKIIRIDFFQKDIDGLPIYYPNFMFSTINALIAGGQNAPQVVEASFSYHYISNDSATYPIKSSSQAFEELKREKAIIISYSGKTTDILIKNVFLAYYLDQKNQKHLMPIIVFEGNDDFVAYVSAVKDEWINN